MGGTVRHIIGSARSGGKAALIAGAAAALLSTGIGTVTNVRPTLMPTTPVSHMNPQARHSDFKPRTGSARPRVRLSPDRGAVAERLVPTGPPRDLLTTH